MRIVLDAFGDVDPSKIIVKMKLHPLTHLAQDIRCFGPAIHNSTEIFECFNRIFRLCSIYNNHQAPSQDIATKLAFMDHLKHILAGGYWKEGESWVQAGDNVLWILQTNAIIQWHLGWVLPQQVMLGMYPQAICHGLSSPVWMWLKCTHIGSIRLAGKAKNPPQPWIKTLASTVITNPPVAEIHWQWQTGVTVIAQSGDKCASNSWIFFKQGVHLSFQINVQVSAIFNSRLVPFQNENTVGHIAEIISSEGAPTQRYITIERFSIAEALHPQFR